MRTAGYWLAVHLLVRHLADPLDTLVHDQVLAHLTANTYVAHAAGLLTPDASAAPLSAAVTLPLAQTAVTALYVHLRCLRPGAGAAYARP
ncbi:hypothetical protein [Streptomyces aurantiogriseus]|uniref:Uncharacterized protein n=1 Tax=Streptomyces aurantiogriseus TaxID=66870 RepID=A0A918FJC2_9ACTN|nr:hypothetical protein [Streptomyces aurantiogriseus]GGR42339.1 hypothetical protein GCM10010251_69200 [Streptomyces aurantiogriseus]